MRSLLVVLTCVFIVTTASAFNLQSDQRFRARYSPATVRLGVAGEVLELDLSKSGSGVSCWVPRKLFPPRMGLGGKSDPRFAVATRTFKSHYGKIEYKELVERKGWRTREARRWAKALRIWSQVHISKWEAAKVNAQERGWDEAGAFISEGLQDEYETIDTLRGIEEGKLPIPKEYLTMDHLKLVGDGLTGRGLIPSIPAFPGMGGRQ